jgi:hypothetical protein
MKYDTLKQTIAAALAAIVLTSTAVGAAVGPARAIETGPAIYAQAEATVAHV